MTGPFLFVAERLVGLLRDVLAEGFQKRAARPFLEQRERATTVRRVLSVDQFGENERFQLFRSAKIDDVRVEHRRELGDVITRDEHHLQTWNLRWSRWVSLTL